MNMPILGRCGHNSDCPCGAPLEPYPTDEPEDMAIPRCTGDPGDLKHECGVWFLAGFRVGDDGAQWRAAHGPAGAPTRICPACGVNVAAPGDRYCADCGSAPDRSSWVYGPEFPTYVGSDGREHGEF